ncbi:uncharacterized protein Dana_GF15879, isoform A [Drosophila ananassae]|nr:uncharacterized protein LOC6498683 [Drosophila ananassae]EDV32543.2 uncharacterized protein Dana_GF15879, isoform A [Drosophila ananassae]
MPNFNGAIIVHTLQLINSPATLREIVVTIAKHTQLPQDELKVPVKQTLEMGQRLGFLQKLNGRYFLVPMTFQTLMTDVQALELPEKVDKTKPAKTEKKAPPRRSPSKSTLLESKTSKKSVKSLEESKSQLSVTKCSTVFGPRFKNILPPLKGIPPSVVKAPIMATKPKRFN